MLIPNIHSFTIVSKKTFNKKDDFTVTDSFIVEENFQENINKNIDDGDRRSFLKFVGGASVGAAVLSMIPTKAQALIVGSSPTAGIVGVKNTSNVGINPATEETLQGLISGQGVKKGTISLSASGVVLTPASGKKIRIYANRFSLTNDAALVSFRFTSGGTDFEKYVSPKTGGLYGANNHPNFVEGGTNEVLYCVISGTTNVQINFDYLEI
jgi:hypothetical protein